MTYGEMLETKGRVTDKQDVLIRLLSRKFDLSDAERESIRGVEDRHDLSAIAKQLGEQV